MKTLQELNKKATYRFVKVLYFSSFLALVLITGITIYKYSDYYPYNENKTRISCVDGYISKDILKSTYGILGNNLTLDQKKKIGKEVCGVNPDSIDSFEKYGKGDILLSDNNVFTASRGVMEESFNIWYFVKYFSLNIIGLLFIFELIRRVFYYIVFGTFRPSR